MSSRNSAKIGWVLCRVVVPLWVAAGAAFKLVENSPRLLPRETILNVADQWGLNLQYLLATLIALELVAVIVMLMLSRLARPMAIFVLSVFCVILVGEWVQGNLSSCGCFGDVPIPPWAMLILDGALLLGVVLFDPSPVMPATPTRWPAIGAVVLILGGSAATFWRVLPRTAPTPPTPAPGNTKTPQLPSYWISSDLEAWIGKSWREIDLIGYITEAPRDLDHGQRFVVFYGRMCEHCEDMFKFDLVRPALGSMTTAVMVPHSKDERLGPDPFLLPQTQCELRELPLGCDWLITTPLIVTLEDGIVTCAEEGDHKACMGLPAG